MDDNIKRKILNESYTTPYSVHPGTTKICLTCQQVKAEHQRPAGLLQLLNLPEWKWEDISMDFVVGLLRTTGQKIVRLHGVQKLIVSDRDRKFTSRFWESLHRAMGTQLKFSTTFHPQTDGQSERTIQILEDMLRALGERKFLGPKAVLRTSETVDKIRARMLVAQSRQKIYADPKRQNIDFHIRDMVFLRVSSMKGIKRFGKKGKLSARFNRPFEILERIGQSSVQKYVLDPSHILSYEALELQPDLSYEEQLVQVLDRREKVVRNKTIALIKVLWKNSKVEEATWELETYMQKKYPELFRKCVTRTIDAFSGTLEDLESPHLRDIN
ncbi:uncharacterized protein LOC115719806 [Cannabis sativa]|uniref:uncharacterized protein LOC115719806 n=1 Tax=Cannabis sativa TaxID=3483 RepID=UPI0029CA6489|nr:uncharacterized protein LOC115719806 [Cannabis sativa]